MELDYVIIYRVLTPHILLNFFILSMKMRQNERYGNQTKYSFFVALLAVKYHGGHFILASFPQERGRSKRSFIHYICNIWLATRLYCHWRLSWLYVPIQYITIQNFKMLDGLSVQIEIFKKLPPIQSRSSAIFSWANLREREGGIACIHRPY